MFLTIRNALYLIAIKQAFESGKFSNADCLVLSTLFEQGLLYQNILNNGLVCDDDVITKITEFCELIEKVLPAPEVAGDIKLELVKSTNNQPGVLDDLLDSLSGTAENIFKAVVFDLITVFQCSILDLSVALKTDHSLTKNDVDNLNYVVGMAEITTMNLGSVIKQVETHDGITRIVRRFFVDAVRFANELRAGGFGLVG